MRCWRIKDQKNHDVTCAAPPGNGQKRDPNFSASFFVRPNLFADILSFYPAFIIVIDAIILRHYRNAGKNQKTSMKNIFSFLIMLIQYQ